MFGHTKSMYYVLPYPFIRLHDECCPDLPSLFLSLVRTSRSPLGTAGCPQDSHVPEETSQSNCPSHPTVPRGLRDVLRTPMSQHRHHSPTVLPIPLSQGDCGMSSGLPCPSTDITVPLSFPSQSPKGTAGCPQDSHVPAQTSQSHCPSHPKVPRGLRDVLRTPMSQYRHHSPTVLPIPLSQGDCGMSSGLPCSSIDITVPLSFPSHCPKGTAGCPQDSHVPAQTSQSHCPSHPKVPRGLRDVLRTPMSQHRHHSPTVPRGLRDVLRTPMSQHRHHSPTVLPIPKSQGDCGMSSGLPCPSTDITVPLSFPSHCPKGTAGFPQDSDVPAQTSQSHCPSHPTVPRGLRDVLRTPLSQHRHHSPTVLPIPKSQGTVGCPQDSHVPVQTSQSQSCHSFFAPMYRLGYSTKLGFQNPQMNAMNLLRGS